MLLELQQLRAVPTTLCCRICPSPPPHSSLMELHAIPLVSVVSQNEELSSPPCDKSHSVLHGNGTGTADWLVVGDIHLKEEILSAMTVRLVSSNFQ